MATEVPLVTTRVGQALDLVRHGENGWIVDVEDVERARRVGGSRRAMRPRASSLTSSTPDVRPPTQTRTTALRPRWRELFDGFVALPELGG